MPSTQTHCIACGIQFTTSVISNAGVLCVTCAAQGLFRKQIIITGITRMKYGNICVSGIDPQTWRFVRPLFSTGLNRDFTMEGTTQVINHFNVVEIEFTGYRPGHVYHTEDWMINPNFAPRFLRHLSNGEIVQILNRMAISDLNLAMAPEDRSLFIVRVQRITNVWDEISYGKFKVRMSFIDHSGNFHNGVPVTDLLTLAFVRYQKSRGNDNYATEIMNAFNNNPYRFIRIGLSRFFLGRHWPQVTALITIPDLFDGRSFSFFENQIGDQV